MKRRHWRLRFAKKVNIKTPIDPDKLHIEKDDSFQMAYAFELPLDSIPDSIWSTIFEDERRTSLYTLKRRITIEGNKLRVITAPEEVEGKIEWVKELVNSTNNRVEQYNQQIERTEVVEKAQKAHHEKVMKQMREKLRKKTGIQ